MRAVLGASLVLQLSCRRRYYIASRGGKKLLYRDAKLFVIVLACILFVVSPRFVLAETAINSAAIEAGKKIFFDGKKGNCLACHKAVGGTLPGDIGPELINMSSRYSDKTKLRSQIWDATSNNPDTIMPPFGRNKILTDDEIDFLTEFVNSL